MQGVCRDITERRQALNLARDIQSRLYPQRMPQIEGYDFYGCCVSAEAVGGDYYDFMELANRRVAVMMGDVSGHGL